MPISAILKESRGDRPPTTQTLMIDFPTLQSKDGTMLVGFYPVQTPCGDISEEWCMQILSWKGVDQISKKYLNRVEKSLAIRDRLAHDYILTGDNQSTPQQGNPFYGAV